MVVVFIRKNCIRMVFVYFAFWGLQEEFSTLPCSPCFLHNFGCCYIILMRPKKNQDKNEQFNITFTQFIFERKCGADLTLFFNGAEMSCFWWFSPISSNNKTDCHNITEILFKVALNTITLTKDLYSI